MTLYWLCWQRAKRSLVHRGVHLTGARTSNEKRAGAAKPALLPNTLVLGKRRVALDQRTARVGNNNRTQIVTIPLEYRFPEGANT
jgi:hypothetical protein